VLGLFVLAVDLEQAELAAERVCRRALESLPALRGGSLLGCGAGFVRAFFEADLAVPGAAGRKGTGPLQDSPAL
jgi:hypothetical protein